MADAFGDARETLITSRPIASLITTHKFFPVSKRKRRQNGKEKRKGGQIFPEFGFFSEGTTFLEVEVLPLLTMC